MAARRELSRSTWTREGVPSPGNAVAWNHQILMGGGNRKGMIANPIYTGRVVWGCTKNVLNPTTGKRVKRAVPQAERITADAPHLRIIDQVLWDRAQAVRRARSVDRLARVTPVLARKEYLLSGLLRCGSCKQPHAH